MATENTVMAAALTPGETVIGNAACEPHIQDLCRFLVSLGAEIEGIESNVLRDPRRREALGRRVADRARAHRGRQLHRPGGRDRRRRDDRRRRSRRTSPAILPAFERLGVHVEIDGTSVRVPPGQELAILDDLGGQIPKIEDGPWPAFPADLTSIA